MAGSFVIGSGERFEEDFLKFFRHADAVIFDDEFVAAAARGVLGNFRNRQTDVAAVGGVLDGIGQQVGHQLLQSQAVAAHFFMLHAVETNGEGVVMGLDVRLVHHHQVIHHVGQTEILFRQGETAAFDAGHIEDFIDESQKMAAGLGDFRQAILDPFLLVNVSTGNGGHAHDGVHRRPDIMGHVGQEIGFRLAGPIGCGAGFLQGFAGCPFQSFFLGGVLGEKEHLLQLSVLPCQRGNSHTLESLFIVSGIFQTVNGVRIGQHLSQIGNTENIRPGEVFHQWFVLWLQYLLCEVGKIAGYRVGVIAAGVVIEGVGVFRQVADADAIHQTTGAFEEQIQCIALFGQCLDVSIFLFCLGDVADEENRTMGTLHILIAANGISYPSGFPIHMEAALQGQFVLLIEEFLVDVGRIKK